MISILNSNFSIQKENTYVERNGKRGEKWKGKGGTKDE